MVAVAKRVDEPGDAQHKAVAISRRHRAHSHASQRLDGPRRPLVFFITVPEPATIPIPKRVGGAVLAQCQCCLLYTSDAADDM
eukprot:6707705-Prymnesium_polylepis.1